MKIVDKLIIYAIILFAIGVVLYGYSSLAGESNVIYVPKDTRYESLGRGTADFLREYYRTKKEKELGKSPSRQQQEVTIYRPDGTVEFCTVHKDGTVWCR